MRIRDLADNVISPAEAHVTAIYGQAEFCEGLPLSLSYFPAASMNPFQRLLYSGSAEAGFAVVPAMQMQDLGRIHWKGRSLIHLHWLGSVLQGVETRGAAADRIDGFRADLAAWRSAGHKVLWSMHNVLPHDCPFPEAEVALRNVLVEGSDAIHVLSVSSVDEARKHYEVPGEKVFHVPHPSYEGWYANVDNPVSARLDLDLPASAFVFLFFGSLQPYKGVLELVEAYHRLRAANPGRQFRLLIAGKPVDPGYVRQVEVAVAGEPSIRFVPSAMEERQLQVLFNAADVVVAPYRRTLNSGVAMLAATFRKSLVAPNGSGVSETFADDPALLYDNDREDGLLTALERSLRHRVSAATFDRILARHHPHRISDEFFEGVRRHLFNDVAGGRA